jgi:LDH2 family malate/lactate/ureidoglycolate dehydrogenase
MIPLLKTAKISLSDNVLEIETTTFCQSKCAESTIRQVIEVVARSFQAEKINIIVPGSNIPETTTAEESSEDIARAIFE